ncbi:hypothetical protein B0H16DRAFT_1816512 [Mycena metata]|uniref:Uncharacterized protein n=1 Tax=Mycena metata TaxID=1033252 RepID=A0AAD7H3V5_9AGAR|nr:hypothetical protein B0H16DRAFT_1816512 [Mycena metata]
MCPPGPRFACAQCPPAQCAVFVASEIDVRTGAAVPRLTPTSTSEVCACGHGWIAHEGVPCNDATHPNYAFRRGPCPASNCGGFYSHEARWAFSTVCICMAIWMSHNGVVTLGSSAPVNSGLPLPTTATDRLEPSLAAPVHSYQGVPGVVDGPVGTRRVASALRTLPQHQATTSALASSAIASSSAAARRGPRRAFPAGPSPFSNTVNILFALYPLVIPGLHEPAGYGTTVLKAQNDNMLTILTRLKQHGLVFPVAVPRAGLASPQEFHAQVVAALRRRDLMLRESPTSTNTDAAVFAEFPWVLLAPTRRESTLTFKPHPRININTFGIEEFKKLSNKFTNPDPLDGATSKLIWGAPRFAHVMGPINLPEFSAQDLPPTEERTLPHVCYGLRVIDRLPILTTAMAVDVGCLDGLCPIGSTARYISKHCFIQ